MSGISTHVLDTSRGRPAAGIAVKLEVHRSGEWIALSDCVTDADGRCSALLGGNSFIPATYRLTFLTAPYFESHDAPFLYPEVTVSFVARVGEEHYHIPLLLGPNTFTTYWGS